jgi:transcriptional regulator with XRE-family HTH domain
LLLELRKIIAQNVLTLRKQLGYSQADLARLLKVNKQTVWRIEAGSNNIGVDTVEQLAKALRVDAATLLYQRRGSSRTKHVVNVQRLDSILDCMTKALRLAKAYRSQIPAA